MSRTLTAAASSAWTLAAAMLAPFAISAAAIWMLPPGPSQAIASWGLALSDLILVASMGSVRIGRAGRRSTLTASKVALASLPSLCTLLTCALTPAFGFRWTFALLMGALAGQGLWDFGGSSMPRILAAIRPAVTVGALIALLVGFMGC